MSERSNLEGFSGDVMRRLAAMLNFSGFLETAPSLPSVQKIAPVNISSPEEASLRYGVAAAQGGLCPPLPMGEEGGGVGGGGQGVLQRS